MRLDISDSQLVLTLVRRTSERFISDNVNGSYETS